MDYTKGEWELRQSPFVYTGMNVYAGKDSDSLAIVHPYPYGHPSEGQANAHLIAAAPSLYEATGDVAAECSRLEQTGLTPEQQHIVNAIKEIVMTAQAKAEGRE